MDAMILAAGIGTRLKPLTDRTPKALIEVGGVTMLERIARRLIDAGADRIIVNAHHHAMQIERSAEQLAANLHVEVLVSREIDRPLETGGGLLYAAPLFRRGSPFFLHNVDLVTDFDLASMYATHERSGALATLAVNRRDTSRWLLFDEEGLRGREDERAGTTAAVREAAGGPLRIAFAGVHVVDPGIFDLITERGTFSILDAYLRLAGEGHRILPYDVSRARWFEIGTTERLDRARRLVTSREKRFPDA
ncbi:MAG: NTP transferase domain-containing protein [Gemmatimonadetes bacterium]|nr:NTP transferase domain-containing protein [Gemmatimonadota bacterium]